MIDETTAISALETALPPEILQVTNPQGVAKLEEICRNLEEEFNSPMLLYDDANKLRDYAIDEDKIQGRL